MFRLTPSVLQMARRCMARRLLVAATPALLASAYARDTPCGGAWQFPCDDKCSEGTVFYSPSTRPTMQRMQQTHKPPYLAAAHALHALVRRFLAVQQTCARRAEAKASFAAQVMETGRVVMS